MHVWGPAHTHIHTTNQNLRGEKKAAATIGKKET